MVSGRRELPEDFKAVNCDPFGNQTKKKKEEETERKSENISEWSHQSTSAGTSNYVFMTCVASLSGHKKYAESLKIEKRISSSSDFIIEPSSDHHRGRG